MSPIATNVASTARAAAQFSESRGCRCLAQWEGFRGMRDQDHRPVDVSMNAVEIEEAVSALADATFDANEFLHALLYAFGNKATTTKGLRSGTSNRSGICGVLQTGHIHVMTCAPAKVAEAFATRRGSPANARQGEVRSRNGWSGGLGRAPDPWRHRRLQPPWLARSFRVLPAARGHLGRKADPRERLRRHGLPDGWTGFASNSWRTTRTRACYATRSVLQRSHVQFAFRP